MFAEVEALVVRDDLDVGVQRGQRDPRRLGLRHADAVGGVQDLPLQVRVVDDVLVDDAERADAGGGQVEAGGRAEAARADHQTLEESSFSWPASPTSGMRMWRLYRRRRSASSTAGTAHG